MAISVCDFEIRIACLAKHKSMLSVQADKDPKESTGPSLSHRRVEPIANIQGCALPLGHIPRSAQPQRVRGDQEGSPRMISQPQMVLLGSRRCRLCSVPLPRSASYPSNPFCRASPLLPCNSIVLGSIYTCPAEKKEGALLTLVKLARLLLNVALGSDKLHGLLYFCGIGL